MAGRVQDKVAVVMGGGQTPGATIGNGRATSILLAREGAKVLVVDRDLASAQDTVDAIRAEGGTAEAIAADVREESEVRAAIDAATQCFGRLDFLHNNVGASLAIGDAPATDLSVEAWDRIFQINVRGMWLACKWAIPVMRAQGGGSIVNISSAAASHAYPWVGYKTTKTAVIGLTEQLAGQYAGDMIRVNTILPGLMNTPMAIESRVAAGTPREQVVAERDARIPLGKQMGSAWDVAYAALFLHSDEARFITGISLRIDGGMQIAH
ncbi:MAG: SDR family oxidoreductase [Chloroflexi bacterium]|nr:SDR family NAD(P)-dependent oxidoreductase [Chloroflexota bacterium]MQC48502.1 SDR family oxidoreductase [Chloroflexota bacterium]